LWFLHRFGTLCIFSEEIRVLVTDSPDGGTTRKKPDFDEFLMAKQLTDTCRIGRPGLAEGVYHNGFVKVESGHSLLGHSHGYNLRRREMCHVSA
jgi:hypothetical protein